MSEQTTSPSTKEASAVPAVLKNLGQTALRIRVVLLKKEFLLEELVHLNLGKVLKFNESINADAKMDINGRPFAHGEIVQKKDQYAIQIKEILS